MRLSSESFSASAAIQFLTSPGGSIPHSFRIRPEDPPSSVTATTAVIFRVKDFMPRRSVDNPVPPPTATIYGPEDSLRLMARSNAGLPDDSLSLPNMNNIISVVMTPSMNAVIVCRVLCPCELRIHRHTLTRSIRRAIQQQLQTCAALQCSL